MERFAKLSERFTKNDLSYTLIMRNEFVALFGVGGTYNSDALHYEVIKILRIPGKVIFGKYYSAHEAIPGNEFFGKEGSRCIKNREDAEDYFYKLTKILKDKFSATEKQ